MFKKTAVACLLLLSIGAGPGWAQVGMSPMCALPEVGGWVDRDARIDQAHALEITFFIDTAKDSWRVDAVRTSAGTVGCVVQADGACQSLRDIGVEMEIGDLVDWAIANTLVQGPSRTLPGSGAAWPLPVSTLEDGMLVAWSDWSFNPEAGMPMPGAIALKKQEREGRSWTMRVDRFLLIP